MLKPRIHLPLLITAGIVFVITAVVAIMHVELYFAADQALRQTTGFRRILYGLVINSLLCVTSLWVIRAQFRQRIASRKHALERAWLILAAIVVIAQYFIYSTTLTILSIGAGLLILGWLGILWWGSGLYRLVQDRIEKDRSDHRGQR